MSILKDGCVLYNIYFLGGRNVLGSLQPHHNPCDAFVRKLTTGPGRRIESEMDTSWQARLLLLIQVGKYITANHMTCILSDLADVPGGSWWNF